MSVTHTVFGLAVSNCRSSLLLTTTAGWFAAIFATTLLATDPGAYACIKGQSSNTVQTATLSHIQQIIMDFAVAIYLTAVFPYLAKKRSLPLTFQKPIAVWFLLPSIKATEMILQTPTHGAYRVEPAMLVNTRVPHFVSLAKYAVVFFRISRPSVIRASSCFRRRISDDCRSASAIASGDLLNFFFHR
tara:strand:- start:514 stop:1077 length:564 start_codon:yes stop_codon:yes gene_type:complete